MAPKRIVILGGGFGGLYAARALQKALGPSAADSSARDAFPEASIRTTFCVPAKTISPKSSNKRASSAVIWTETAKWLSLIF